MVGVQGKQWNGRLFKKKEFVIDKGSKLKDLKLLIANLLRSGGRKEAAEEIVKRISLAKGFSATPMKSSNVGRLQWVHRAALNSIGVDHDRYFYKMGSAAEEHSELEVMTAMVNALAAENEEVVSRPPFHLRNGDLVVWTDVGWRPTEKHIALKQVS